jgi:hypothetical protein
VCLPGAAPQGFLDAFADPGHRLRMQAHEGLPVIFIQAD